MLAVFLQTLPFFGIIALGYGAGRSGFFSPEATAYLTKFVFFFALSAMVFRFAANLSLAEVLDWQLVTAYLSATAVVYLIVVTVALLRKVSLAEAAVEAQSAAIGNVGFLGIPMFVVMMGENAIGPVMLILAVDLVVFGSLIVILITGSKEGKLSLAIVQSAGTGLLSNPMIVSISLGLIWSAFALPIPVPMNAFLEILGAAATPGALFAIGASLATKSAERIEVAGWLAFAKLFLHPVAVGLAVYIVLPVDDTFAAGLAVASAALPTAGNVYILAQHYGVAPARASATILISTAFSILTVPAVIAWIG